MVAELSLKKAQMIDGDRLWWTCPRQDNTKLSGEACKYTYLCILVCAYECMCIWVEPIIMQSCQTQNATRFTVLEWVWSESYINVLVFQYICMQCHSLVCCTVGLYMHTLPGSDVSLCRWNVYAVVHCAYIQVDVYACCLYNLGLSDYGNHVEHKYY